MNEKEEENFEYDKDDQTSILLCLIKLKLYWFDMEIVPFDQLDADIGASETLDLLIETRKIAYGRFELARESHQMLGHLLASQLCGKAILEAFFASELAGTKIFDIRYNEISTQDLFEWMDALGCLDAYSKVGSLVEQYYSELLKIKEFIASNWKMSAEFQNLQDDPTQIGQHDDNIPEWV